MHLKLPLVFLAGGALALVSAAVPAQAQAQSGVKNRPAARAIAPRARITVRTRSYLDPGPEVMPYSQSYTNYLFLNSTPGDSLGPLIDRKRNYPDPWNFENTTGWR